ncbi:MAG: hypothetical protein HY560_10345 [Gemmatimonadetes bacterium]|nr:hypothetical protein [Gemmatimonadota bacterium]
MSQPPGFTTLAIAPTLDYLERAHDDAKYGRVSQQPYVEARSDEDPSAGRRTVRLHVQYTPDTLHDGTWDETRRRALGELAIDTVAEHAAGLKATIEDCAVYTPRDLAEAYAFPEGHAYHGELTLDQILFMRPVPGCARYRTPVTGLYVCGPGTHPGGGVAGAAGANAARVILGRR